MAATGCTTSQTQTDEWSSPAVMTEMDAWGVVDRSDDGHYYTNITVQQNDNYTMMTIYANPENQCKSILVYRALEEMSGKENGEFEVDIPRVEWRIDQNTVWFIDNDTAELEMDDGVASVTIWTTIDDEFMGQLATGEKLIFRAMIDEESGWADTSRFPLDNASARINEMLAACAADTSDFDQWGV